MFEELETNDVEMQEETEEIIAETDVEEETTVEAAEVEAEIEEEVEEEVEEEESEDSGRITGTVKWFSNPKGYGFISRDDGEDVFVHYSSISGGGFRSLEEGERVEFSIEQSDKGPRAVNVKSLQEDTGWF